LTAASSRTSWTAKSSVTWITLLVTASGTGNEVIPYTVAPNTGTAARTGTLTIAGMTFTVTQQGAACAYSLKAGAVTPAAGGFTASLQVTAATGCAWKAASNTSGITLASGASGAGNGVVVFAAAANSGTTARTGSLTVAGYTVTVTEGSRTSARIVRVAGQRPRVIRSGPGPCVNTEFRPRQLEPAL
jgi:hypothetical protein